MAAIAPLATYRYQAPSCLLRVTGQLSALSQLTSPPVITGLRFDLQIWSDEDRESMVDHFPLLDLRGEQTQLLELSNQVQNYVQGHLQGQTASPVSAAAWITLTGLGLTRHALRIHRPEPRVVILSTLQLADLADVLEQMDSQIQVKLGEKSPSVRLPAWPGLWIGSVAAVLVAAVLGNQWLLWNPPVVVRSPQPMAPEAATPPRLSHQPEPSRPVASAPRPPLPRSSPPSPVNRQLPQTVRGAAGKSAVSKTPDSPPILTPPTPVSPATRPQENRESHNQGSPPPLSARITASQTGPPVRAGLELLRQALQAGWTVPAQLAESLPYQVTLTADGTVITVQPLTSLARDYQAQTGLPLVNQMISGLSLRQRTTVEVVYLLDGSVRVVPQPQPQAP
ncbi:MAG: DUF4335 domain-containing protein [Nodosilinea sp.]